MKKTKTPKPRRNPKKANAEALAACRALVRAYNWGAAMGDSMEWEHVDMAYETALEALVANGEDPDEIKFADQDDEAIDEEGED